MIAGRGLGYTGGTLDKLESIAGYSTRLNPRAFERVLGRVGASIIGQSSAIAPADGKMYALRDVTATVDYIPLIVASILSKKLACAADALVMDVKCGRGAFMKSRRDAVALARSLVQVGSHFGRRVVALVTQMNTPIGRTIGNALEVSEAIDILRGGGPDDTMELTRALAVEMLLVGSVTRKRQHAEDLLSQKQRDGSALTVFRNMIAAHGGDARVVDDPSRLPRSKFRIPITSSKGGYVRDIDAGELGRVAFELGAGRLRVDQEVDHAVGVELEATLRSHVKKGQVLAWLHVEKERDAVRATHTVRNAFSLGATKPKKQRLILERIGR
jgi:pyrimidine-nucleoside phosphorylase